MLVTINSIAITRPDYAKNPNYNLAINYDSDTASPMTLQARDTSQAPDNFVDIATLDIQDATDVDMSYVTEALSDGTQYELRLVTGNYISDVVTVETSGLTT